MAKHNDSPSTDRAEIEALRQRLRSGSLRQDDFQLLDRLLGLLLSLITLLQRKNASISRLKRWLFGPSSDARTPNKTSPTDEHSEAAEEAASTKGKSASTSTPSRKPGHGRLKAAAYSAAAVVQCANPQLVPGNACPRRMSSKGHTVSMRAELSIGNTNLDILQRIQRDYGGNFLTKKNGPANLYSLLV